MHTIEHARHWLTRNLPRAHLDARIAALLRLSIARSETVDTSRYVLWVVCSFRLGTVVLSHDSDIRNTWERDNCCSDTRRIAHHQQRSESPPRRGEDQKHH